MADKPIREQSALELLETHAKALEQENERLRAENWRLRAEDKLHRDFLMSVIEYHDYGDDNVAFEDVCKAIEKRAQQLDRQLAVSVHEIESNAVETTEHPVCANCGATYWAHSKARGTCPGVVGTYRPAVEMGACNHHFSELLASKGDAFETRQCLECAKIFRVRLPEKAAARQRQD